jgi:hypothetical protein
LRGQDLNLGSRRGGIMSLTSYRAAPPRVPVNEHQGFPDSTNSGRQVQIKSVATYRNRSRNSENSRDNVARAGSRVSNPGNLCHDTFMVFHPALIRRTAPKRADQRLNFKSYFACLRFMTNESAKGKIILFPTPEVRLRTKLKEFRNRGLAIEKQVRQARKAKSFTNNEPLP